MTQDNKDLSPKEMWMSIKYVPNTAAFSLLSQYIFHAFRLWDLTWFTKLGQWSTGERAALLLLGFITMMCTILLVIAARELDNAPR